MDDPKHRAYRALTAAWFGAKSVRNLEDEITALARETIEFLLDASDDPARWEELRRDMERTELDRKVDSLSEA